MDPKNVSMLISSRNYKHLGTLDDLSTLNETTFHGTKINNLFTEEVRYSGCTSGSV